MVHINNAGYYFRMLILVTLAMLVFPAHAQYSGYYGELFYGSGNTEFSYFTDVSDFNGDAEFYGLTVGRRFNDNIAAEASYVQLGDSDSTLSNPVVANLAAEVDSRTLSISVLGNYPLNRYWNIFGKFGLNQWTLDTTVVDTRFTPILGFEVSDSGTGINYSVGARYNITPSYSIQVEYLTYQLNTQLFDDDVAIGGITMGLRYNY